MRFGKDFLKSEKTKKEESDYFKSSVLGGHAGVPAQSHVTEKAGGTVKVKLDLSKAKKYLPPKCSMSYEPRYARIRASLLEEQTWSFCSALLWP